MIHDAAREAVARIIWRGTEDVPFDLCELVTDLILAKLAEMGYRQVPDEATDAMILAAIDRPSLEGPAKRGDMYSAIWRAMLAAIPAPETGT